MQTHYVLIDYENVQVKSLALLKGEHFQVQVFLGPKNLKLHRELVFAMQTFGNRGKYVELEVGGKNALDFHIAYYLGVLAVADPKGMFHVISKDKGFEPLLQHLKAKGVSCARSGSIEAMPCFSQGAAGTIASKPASAAGKSKSVGKPLSLDAMVKLAVDDLIKRKAARPRTPKTLRSTIHARCGKEVAAADIDAVYEALVERGYVKLDGAKVTYALPAEQEAEDGRA
jgi:hypothetical protein